MLNSELMTQNIPFLRPEDKVGAALQMMNSHTVTQLPVVDNKAYLGIYNEEYLLQEDDENITIGELKESPQLIGVNTEDHFLRALKIAVDFNLSVVPVLIHGKELAGVITNTDLIRQFAEFVNVNEPGGLIVLQMEGKDYSFAEISRLVETNDAQITQLNTFTDPETGIMLVTVKINKLEISDIVSTFQRYEYHIKYYFGEEFYENEIRSNYDNLMNYLKI